MKKPGILEAVALLTTIFFFGAMEGGSFFAFLFLYLAPLPLFILGLKKDNPWCGLVGAVAAVSLFFHYYAANVDYVFASHRSSNNVFLRKSNFQGRALH